MKKTITFEKKLTFILIVAILISIVGALYLTKEYGEPLEADSGLFVPRYTSTCCEEGTPRYSLNMQFYANNYKESRLDIGDMWTATYTCTGAGMDSCKTTFSDVSIICPEDYVGWYNIKMNEECVRGLGVDNQYSNYPFSYDSACDGKGTGDYTFDDTNTIKIQATCYSLSIFPTNTFKPPIQITPTALKVLQTEKELFCYGHDIPIYNVPNSYNCVKQGFYDSYLNNQQIIDDNKMSEDIKEGNEQSSFGAYISSKIGGFLKPVKKDLIEFAPPTIPLRDCYLAIYDYRPLLDVNTAYYKGEPVYCDKVAKKLLSFEEFTTKGGTSYKIPTNIVLDGAGRDFCCTNADCPGGNCDTTTFTCTIEGFCNSIIECALYTSPTYQQTADGWIKTYTSSCTDNKCVDTTKIVKCTPTSCPAGMYCDENKGCLGNKYLCPQDKCCENSNAYVTSTCSNMGYSENYQCCTNLDSRQGVGECKISCEVCNNNKICEASIGETADNCPDCYVCGDGILVKGETCETCPADVRAIYGANACPEDVKCKPYDIVCLFNQYIMNPLHNLKNYLISAYKSIALFVAIIGVVAGFLLSYDKLKTYFKKEKDEPIKIGLSAGIGIIIGYLIYVNFAIGLLIGIIMGLYMVGLIAWKVIK